MRNAVKQFCCYLVLTALTLGAISCSKKKDDPTPDGSSRNIKYELTGNYTGKLTIIYNDNVNGNTVLTDVSLPWTKEITYAANVTGIGIGAQGFAVGTTGQTATLKVYSGGKVIKDETQAANANGVIQLTTFSHIF